LKEVEECCCYEDCQYISENIWLKYRRKCSRRAPGNNYHGLQEKKNRLCGTHWKNEYKNFCAGTKASLPAKPI
jgi:hypothetical protein